MSSVPVSIRLSVSSRWERRRYVLIVLESDFGLFVSDEIVGSALSRI